MSLIIPAQPTEETVQLEQQRLAKDAVALSHELVRSIAARTGNNPVLAIVILLRATALVAVQTETSLQVLVQNLKAVWEGVRAERGIG